MNINVVAESHPSKIGGIYPSESTAQAAKQKLITEGGFSADVVEIVTPLDPALGDKVEPEDKGIAKTAAKSHVVFGAIGLAVGLLIATLLVTNGPAIATSSPVMVYIVFAIFSPLIAMLLAGLFSLRPDHDRVINKTRSAAKSADWTVIVHTKGSDEMERAESLLEQGAQKVVKSL